MLDGFIQQRRHQIQIDVACNIPPGRMTDYKETFSQNHPAYGLIRDVQMKKIKNQTIKKTLNIDIQKSFYFETDTEISGNQQETIEAEKDKTVDKSDKQIITLLTESLKTHDALYAVYKEMMQYDKIHTHHPQ